MKRLSKSLITALLVTLLAFAFIGCGTTEKVEDIPPMAAVEAPVGPEEAEIAEVAEPEAPAPAEVEAPVEVEEAEPEVAEAPKMMRKAPTEDMVVKSNDRFTEFDLYIAHTNDVNGAIEEGEGIGYAKLATGIKYGRSLTDKTLLLDAGNVASGSPMVEKFYGEPAGALLDMLGYDAVAPGPEDFAYGAEYLKSAARFAQENSDLRVLSANVLNADGEWVFQPYQLYYFNDFVVAVAGVTAPPADTEGLSFIDPAVVENAQYAVDEIRKVADFVVLLGNIGNVNGITSEVIAENIDGIDLIVDGKGAMAPAGGKKVGMTTIVNAGENMSSVGLVEIHVKDDMATAVTPIRITAKDVQNPKASPLAKAVGITNVPADPETMAYVDYVKKAYAKTMMKEAPAKAEKPAKAEAPAKEEAKPEVAEAPKMMRKAPTEDMVVKSNDRFTEFDLYIAHTNDVNGAIEEGEGIGYAKLATGIKYGRSLTDKTLLLDAGNVASGSPMVEKFYGEPAGALLDMLGYDAVAPGPEDFAYGAEYLKSAARFAQENSDLRVLSANVLNADGEWVFQPYQLYYFNDFVVAVAGVTAPPADTEGLSFIDPAVVENAQYAVDEIRKVADFVVLLGNIGNVNGITSEVIAENIDGIDLIVDGKGAMAPAGGKKVGMTTIVNAGENMSSVGLVEIHVKDDMATAVTPIRITAKDVQNPKASPLAKAVGITNVPADPETMAYVDYVKKAYAKTMMKEAPAKAEKPAKAEAPAKEEAKAPMAPAKVEKAMPDVDDDVIVKSYDGEKNFNLYVVHTNDVHGRIEASDDVVGYARLATLLKMGRSVTDKALVLDAGDVTHGTLLTNMFEGETAGVLLDMLGYDAVAPGNHEFNYGKERLIEAAKIAEAATDIKVLSANILDEDGNMVFQPYQLYYFDGFTVGVIGLTTPDTETKTHPKNVKGLSFMSDEVVNNAQALVDEVNRRADYVIVLGHVGLDEDGSYGVTSKMIAENIDGIDLFIDGHSHDVLENGMRVEDTLIASAGEYMNYVGIVEIQVRNGKAVDENAYLISAEQVSDPSTSEFAQMLGIKEVKEDPEVLAYIESQKAKLAEITQEVVAYTPVKLDGERANVRTKPTNLGNMIAEAMIEATGADVALTNGGGIRASIEAGDVTRGDIITVLPFNNVVIVVEVTGQDIYDALEWGYSRLPETNGGFPQTANMRIIYSRYSDPGNRIKRVLVNGKSIDKDATYTLATNDFLAAGGDGYTMLDKPVVMYGKGLDEVLTDYLVEHNMK
ncbi:MAG: 5'-nucleotidase C-terminal domain-containing protein [Sphaerochaetaceae bacterium]